MNVVVLGGGPAGRTAAVRLAQEGCQVRLVESGGIGGQCLHYGCMAVCGLNEVARVIEASRRLADLGVVEGVPQINFPGLLAGLHRVQQQIALVLDKETRHAGVEIVYGERACLDRKKVLIGNDVLEPAAVVVSTGSVPFLPPIPGIELPGVYTPHSLREMRTLPEKLVIIGGSVMAAEFAYIFHCFGSEVFVIARSSFLKDLDPHLRRIARRELEEVGILEHTRVTGIRGDGVVNTVITEGKEGAAVMEADAVFVAAGLIPRTEDLRGIEKGPLGEVRVDEFQRTNVPGVFAAGDVTGPPYLTPVARAEGYAAAENILGRKCTVDRREFPQALNLTHELACTGRDSATAVSIAIPGPAGPGSFWSVPYGDTGITKIVFEPGDGRLTGVAVAGPGAGIAASYLGFLIRQGVSVHDFDAFREVHPVSDGVYGLMKFASYQMKKGRWQDQ